MGIQVSQAQQAPAVIYDRVHLTNLTIEQGVFQDDTMMPVYALRVSYRMYGVASGIRYYSPEAPQTIVIPNYLALAGEKAAGGDSGLLNAMAHIEAAVAAIIADKTGNTASVM